MNAPAIALRAFVASRTTLSDYFAAVIVALWFSVLALISIAGLLLTTLLGVTDLREEMHDLGLDE